MCTLRANPQEMSRDASVLRQLTWTLRKGNSNDRKIFWGTDIELKRDNHRVWILSNRNKSGRDYRKSEIYCTESDRVNARKLPLKSV